MSSVNWKTNLVVIWVSQLLSIAGFFFALPYFVGAFLYILLLPLTSWVAKQPAADAGPCPGS